MAIPDDMPPATAGPPCHQQLPPGPRSAQRRRCQQRVLADGSTACGGQRREARETRYETGRNGEEVWRLLFFLKDIWIRFGDFFFEIFGFVLEIFGSLLKNRMIT